MFNSELKSFVDISEIMEDKAYISIQYAVTAIDSWIDDLEMDDPSDISNLRIDRLLTAKTMLASHINTPKPILAARIRKIIAFSENMARDIELEAQAYTASLGLTSVDRTVDEYEYELTRSIDDMIDLRKVLLGHISTTVRLKLILANNENFSVITMAEADSLISKDSVNKWIDEWIRNNS